MQKVCQQKHDFRICIQHKSSKVGRGGREFEGRKYTLHIQIPVAKYKSQFQMAELHGL